MAITGSIYSLAKKETDLTTKQLFENMMTISAGTGAVVIDGRNLAAGSIFAEQIHADAITADKIKAGEIQTDHMVAGSIDVDRLKANQLILPGETYGGVKINNDGMSMKSTGLNVTLSSSSGFNITDKAGNQLIDIDPLTGNVIMQINKMIIGGHNAATQEDIEERVKDIELTPGPEGKGVSTVVREFQNSSSGTTIPTGSWSKTPNPVKGQYMWERVTTNYTKGSPDVSHSVTYSAKDGTPGSPGTPGTPGEAGVGVSGDKIEYARSTSGTVIPTSGWGSSIPSVPEGQFLWTRTTITYTNNKKTETYTSAKQGEKGEPGADAISGVLTNESITLAANSSGTVQNYVGNTGNFLLMEGAINRSTSTSVTYLKVSETNVKATISSNGAYTISSMTGGTNVTAGQVTFRATYKNTTIDKTISISKSIAGQAGSPGAKGDPGAPGSTGAPGAAGSPATSYWLTSSVDTVTMKYDGDYDPKVITFYGYSKTGTSNTTTYAGRFIIQTSTNGTSYTQAYRSSSNQSSYAFTIPSNVSFVKVKFYQAGGTTYLLDEQTVPVLQSAENLEIGGRNLLLNSNFATRNLSKWQNNGSVAFANIDGRNTAYMNTSSGIYQSGVLKDSGIYTFSFMAKALDGTTSARVGFLNAGSGASKTFSLTSTWQRYEFTTTVSIATSQIFHIYSSGKRYYVTDIQVEKGNKSTDWTPAPEDVEDAYTAVAEAKANLAETQAKAYADGVVDDEEKRAIQDAKDKLEEAKRHAEKQVDDIEVGGRNLLKNTGLTDGTSGWSGTSMYELNGETVFRVAGTMSESANIPLEPNQYYTASMELYPTVNIPITSSTPLHTYYRSSASNNGGMGTKTMTQQGSVAKANEWTRITETVKTNQNATTFKFHVYYPAYINSTTPAYVKNIKLEKGNKATGWTPAPEDITLDINKKTYNPVRYIRDWANGSTSNTSSHWYEIQAYVNGENVARGKSVSGDATNPSRITDGNTAGSYASGGTGLRYAQVDLGSVYYNVDNVKVWRYHNDSRRYHETKTEVSSDGTNWVPIFDSFVEGEYPETAAGKAYPNTIAKSESLISAKESMTRLGDDTSKVTISGGNIKAGTISSKNNYSKINLDDGTFSFGNGRLVWNGSDMTVNGKISVTNINGKLTDSQISSAATWNAKETTTGAQTKANTAEKRAKDYAGKTFRAYAIGYSNRTDAGIPFSNGRIMDENGNSITSGNDRSYLLVVIDRSDNVVFQKTYDVYSGATHSKELADKLNSLDRRHLVILVGSHAPTPNRTSSGLPQAIYKCGGTPEVFIDEDWGTSHPVYLLVGRGAIGEGNGFESFSSRSDGAMIDVNIPVKNGTTPLVSDSDIIRKKASNAKTKTDAWSYNGTTEIDGKSIKTGTLEANKITTGTLKSQNGNSSLNLNNGEFNFANGGLVYSGGNLTLNGKLNVTNLDGKLTDSQISSAGTWNAKETTDGALAKANTAEANAKELASAMAFGKMLNTDPTFKYGQNGINKYNNSGGTGVVIDRITKQQNAPTDSTHILRVTTSTAATSPGLGGFTFQTMTSANKTYITRFIAKIPSGRSVIFASNATGSGGSAIRKWLSPNQGTGKWEEYVYKVTAGDTGSFSSTNFFYISGGSKPLTWYIAYATVFDVTDDDLIAHRTNAWSYNGTTEIDGKSIKTGTLEANKITTGTLKSQNGNSWLNLNNGEFNFAKGGLVYSGGNLTLNGKLSVSNLDGAIPKSRLDSTTQSQITAGNTAKTTVDQNKSKWDDVVNKQKADSRLNNIVSEHNLPYTKDIIIYGDSNKYYPVYVRGGNQDLFRTIKIWRRYGERGPNDWHTGSNSTTHKGSLMLTWKGNFGGWGGATYREFIEENTSAYSTLLADCFRSVHSMAYTFMLRGGGSGGAIYHMASDQSLGQVEIYYNGSSDIVYPNSNASHVVRAANPVTEVNGERLENLKLAKSKEVTEVDDKASNAKNKTDAWTYKGETTIDGGAIEADTITATQIAANSITADEIDVDKISALASELGDVTAGTITSENGNIHIDLNKGLMEIAEGIFKIKGKDVADKEDLGQLGDKIDKEVELREGFISSNNGVITIGQKGSPTNIQIKNDRISFMQNGAEVAYITEQTMEITHGIFVKSAKIGEHKQQTLSGGHTVFTWEG